MGYSTQFLGRAGEYAVASQLLARGVRVYFPAVDMGADLLAEGGIRIQVKSRMRPVAGRNAYGFFLGRSAPRDRFGKYNHRPRDWSAVADFMICWAASENRFWIIPTAELAQKNVQLLYLGGPPRWTVPHDKIMEMSKRGISQVEITKELSLSKSTVSASLNPARRPKRFDPSLSNESAKYENAWDQIIANVNLSRQIDAPIEVAQTGE